MRLLALAAVLSVAIGSCSSAPLDDDGAGRRVESRDSVYVNLVGAGGFGDDNDATLSTDTFTNGTGSPVSGQLVVELLTFAGNPDLTGFVRGQIGVRAKLTDSAGAATSASIYLVDPDSERTIELPGASFSDLYMAQTFDVADVTTSYEVHVNYTLDPGDTITLSVSELFGSAVLYR